MREALLATRMDSLYISAIGASHCMRESLSFCYVSYWHSSTRVTPDSYDRLSPHPETYLRAPAKHPRRVRTYIVRRQLRPLQDIKLERSLKLARMRTRAWFSSNHLPSGALQKSERT